MDGFYKAVKADLQKAGFYMARQGRGSHEVWSNGTETVTVSKSCRSRHTANQIMKAAKLKKRF